MIIYLLSLAIISIIGLIFKCNQTKNKKIFFLIFSFLILTTIAMLRSNSVGVDTRQYVRNFSNIASLGFLNITKIRYEIGFSVLCLLLSYISSNSQILIMVTSLIINISIFRFIYKNSDNVVLSVICYIVLNFFFMYMNIMRQALAIAIILWGYDYLQKDRYITFIVIVLLATQFHTSAILAVILLILRICNFDKRFIKITLALSLLGFVFGRNIFLFISKISPRLYAYIGGDYDVSNYFGALINFMIYVFIFITGMIIIAKEEKSVFIDKKNKNNILIGIMGITCVLSALVMRVSIFNRFVPYFSIFVIIWLPNCLNMIKKSKTRLFYSTIIIFTLLTYFVAIMVLRPEWYGVVPYIPIDFCSWN